MIIKIKGQKEIINVNKELIPFLKNKRAFKTNYLNEFKIKKGSVFTDNDFVYRMQCYQNISNSLDDYCSNLDICGGVGITALMFKRLFTSVNDIDKSCNRVLWDNKNLFNFIYNDDYNSLFVDRNYDLLLADFNNYTISKLIKGEFDKVIKFILETASKYIVLNDCSINYLKYGEKSYHNTRNYIGGDFTDEEGFLKQCKVFYDNIFTGWKLVKAEYFRNTSILLFEKTELEKELKINKVTNPEKIVSYEL